METEMRSGFQIFEVVTDEVPIQSFDDGGSCLCPGS